MGAPVGQPFGNDISPPHYIQNEYESVKLATPYVGEGDAVETGGALGHFLESTVQLTLCDRMTESPIVLAFKWFGNITTIGCFFFEHIGPKGFFSLFRNRVSSVDCISQD